MRLLLTISVLLVFITGSAAEGWDTITKDELVRIIEQVDKRFTDSPDYRIDFRMASYRGHIETAAYDTSSGFYIRSDLQYHLYQLGIHSIQNNRNRVIVDVDDKHIMVANVEKEIGPLNDLQLRSMANVSRVAQLKDENGKKVLKMSYDHGLYDHIEVELDQDHWVRKVTLYYAEPMKESPADADYTARKPKVVMTFSAPRFGKEVVGKDKFSIDEYVRFEKGTPIAQKSDHTVFDARVYLR